LSGWKDWQIGEVVEAAEFQTFLQDQVVQVYADSSARGSALGTAVAEGMASYVKDTDSFEVYDGSGWVPVSVDAAWVTAGTAGEILISNGTADPSWVAAETTLAAGTSGFTALSAGTAGISYQPVSHNYIINGAFDFWNRGTTFNSATSNTFFADRWTCFVGGGTNNITQQSFTPDELPAAGYGENTHYLRWSRTSGTGGLNFLQKVEDVRTLAGQTITVSFYAKVDSAINVTVSARQNFGSGGSAQVTQTSGAVALTTSWARYSFQFTLGSLSGKTIGTNSFLQIDVGLPSATTAFVFDIWGVQLEAGSVATPFKRHAPSLQGELAACQRYYQQIDGAGNTTSVPFLNGNIHASTEFRGVLTFNNMRAVPTIVAAAAGAYDCIAGGSGAAVSSFTFGTIGTNTARVIATLSASRTVGHGAYITGNASAAAVFTLSAEL
jgi:hypothetical protein